MSDHAGAVMKAEKAGGSAPQRTQADRLRLERGPAADLVQERLRRMEVGEVVSLDELFEAAGWSRTDPESVPVEFRDLAEAKWNEERGRLLQAVRGARARLRRSEGMEFVALDGDGVQRLDDAGKLKAAQRQLKKARRRAKTAQKIAANVDEEALTEDERRRLRVLETRAGLGLGMLGAAPKKIEALDFMPSASALLGVAKQMARGRQKDDTTTHG